MTSNLEEPTAPPVPQPAPKPNPFKRIIGVLIAPAETFQQIAARPDWLVPLIIIMVIAVSTTLIFMPHFDLEGTMRDASAQSGMSEQEIEKAVSTMANVQRILIPIFSLIGPPIILLIFAAVFLLAFKLFGAEGTFGQTFSTTIYSWMPQMIKSIIVTGLIIPKGLLTETEVGLLLKSNLGFLVDPVEQRIPFALLTSIDVFNIWTLILMIIGYSYVSKMSRGKVAALVITLWAFIVLIKVAFTALQASGGVNS